MNRRATLLGSSLMNYHVAVLLSILFPRWLFRDELSCCHLTNSFVFTNVSESNASIYPFWLSLYLLNLFFVISEK